MRRRPSSRPTPFFCSGREARDQLVRHDGARLDEATFREFARVKLASYKTPRRVLFFAESDLELTGSAKVKTAGLRDLAKTLQAEADA